MPYGNLFPNHPLMLLPGFVVMNAKTTVMVLASTQETAKAKTMAKAISWRRQVTIPGIPMNKKEQRKQNMREMRSKYIRPLLLVFTIAVFRCLMKIHRTESSVKKKRAAKEATAAPKGSS